MEGVNYFEKEDWCFMAICDIGAIATPKNILREGIDTLFNVHLSEVEKGNIDDNSIEAKNLYEKIKEEFL